MHDNQYTLFQDLDRRCVARGFADDDCSEAVRLKRTSIELEQSRGNPVAREVLSGTTTLVEVYDDFSRGLRGIRRFLPLAHAPARNERLRNLAKIVPNVQHFTRRSLFAVDNPITGALYGFLASSALMQVSRLAMRDLEEPGTSPLADWSGGWVAVALTLAGGLAGLLAMVRYRVRDPKRIHAREAAEYMDVNYEYYRANDDDGWSAFLRDRGADPASRIARERPLRRR